MLRPNMEEKLLELLGRDGYAPLGVSELLTALGLPQKQRSRLQQTLARLERSGRVARIKRGNRYALPLEADLVPGRIRVNRQGTGFLQPDNPKLAVLRIPPDAMATAMHGDRVLVRHDVFPRRLRGR